MWFIWLNWPVQPPLALALSATTHGEYCSVSPFQGFYINLVLTLISTNTTLSFLLREAWISLPTFTAGRLTKPLCKFRDDSDITPQTPVALCSVWTCCFCKESWRMKKIWRCSERLDQNTFKIIIKKKINSCTSGNWKVKPTEARTGVYSWWVNFTFLNLYRFNPKEVEAVRARKGMFVS